MCRVFAAQVGPVHVQVMGRDREKSVWRYLMHNQLAGGIVPSVRLNPMPVITSIEIAELVVKRHDNVKRTIESGREGNNYFSSI